MRRLNWICVDIAKCQAKFRRLLHFLYKLQKFSQLRSATWNQPTGCWLDSTDNAASCKPFIS